MQIFEIVFINNFKIVKIKYIYQCILVNMLIIGIFSTNIIFSLQIVFSRLFYIFVFNLV